MDLIPKPRTLKKVQLRDISWNLTPPTPAHGPRGHFIKAFFTPQYSRENVGISRIDLHCQKPLNSLNLMAILKYQISHWKCLKSAVKSGRFWDRGRLAGVWRSSVWQGFSATVRRHESCEHTEALLFSAGLHGVPNPNPIIGFCLIPKLNGKSFGDKNFSFCTKCLNSLA